MSAGRQLIERYFHGVNTEDWDDFRGIWHDDAVIEVVGGIRVQGWDADPPVLHRCAHELPRALRRSAHRPRRRRHDHGGDHLHRRDRGRRPVDVRGGRRLHARGRAHPQADDVVRPRHDSRLRADARAPRSGGCGRSCGMRRRRARSTAACSTSSQLEPDAVAADLTLLPRDAARRGRRQTSSSPPRRRRSGRSSPGPPAPCRSPASTSRSAAASGATRSRSAGSGAATPCSALDPSPGLTEGVASVRARFAYASDADAAGATVVIGSAERPAASLPGSARGLTVLERRARPGSSRRPAQPARCTPTPRSHAVEIVDGELVVTPLGRPRQAAPAVGDADRGGVARRDAAPAEATSPAIAVAVSILLSPIEVGSVEVRNRVAFTAHGSFLDFYRPGVSGDRYVAYEERRAAGGAGLIFLQTVHVHPSSHALGHAIYEPGRPPRRS